MMMSVYCACVWCAQVYNRVREGNFSLEGLTPGFDIAGTRPRASHLMMTLWRRQYYSDDTHIWHQGRA